MDLLRLLETTARQIALQKDKNEAIKQQEEYLRQELAAAHAQLAAKRAYMNEEQQQNFSVLSEIEHQASSIAECQAINDASKAAISSVQHERAQLSELLQHMQEEFIQSSAAFNAEVQGLLAQQLAPLARDVSALGCLLPEVSSDVLKGEAAQAAPAEAADVGTVADQEQPRARTKQID